MLATWQILDAATAARKRLLRAGYFPIPTNGKKPPIAGWTGIVATDAIIESWFSLFPEALNTGILTRTTPAVDVDVYDPDVAAEIEAALWDMIGTRCMVRFGQPPKRAILFRTDTSFAKNSTPVFTSPSHPVVISNLHQRIRIRLKQPGLTARRWRHPSKQILSFIRPMANSPKDILPMTKTKKENYRW